MIPVSLRGFGSSVYGLLLGRMGVGWEEGEYYAADWAEAVAARGLEGWKAGRLEGFSKGTTRASGRCEWETCRGYRGKGGERRSSRKVPGFLGRRQRPLTTRTSKEKKALPSVIIKRCSSHSAWRRAERAKEAAGQVQHSVQHQLCPGSPATLGKHWLPRALARPQPPWPSLSRLRRSQPVTRNAAADSRMEPVLAGPVLRWRRAVC